MTPIRTGRHTGLTVVAVAALAFVLVVVVEAVRENTRPSTPQIPRPRVLDHSSVEHMIEQGGYAGVVCNNAVDPVVLAHARFSCRAAGGQLILVTIVNGGGDYVWTPAS